MIRLYIEPIFSRENSIKNSFKSGNTISLNSMQQHYLGNVMRRRDGDVVLVFNEIEGEWSSFIDKKSIILEQKLRDPEPYTGKSLAVACIKSHRLEILVEKATEIGIDSIFLLHTARSDRRAANLRRLNSIAIEATEQSGRIRPLKLQQPQTLQDFLQKIERRVAVLQPEEIIEGNKDNLMGSGKTKASDDHSSCYNLLENPFKKNKDLSSKDLPVNYQNSASCDAKDFDSLIIGPEGGFNHLELELMEDLPKINLGKNILRTETAAIVASYLLATSQS